MKRIFLTTWIVFLALTGQETFAASLKEFNYLNDIKAYTSETDTRFSVYFKKPIKNYKGPIFYEKSVQIDFPNTYIHPAKRKFQIDDGLVKEVLAYQFSQDVVRVRFVLIHSQYDLDKKFTLDTSERGMVLSLKKDLSDPLVKLLEATSVEPKNAGTQTAKSKVEPGVETTEPLAEKKGDYSGSVSLPEALFESLNPAGPNHESGKDDALSNGFDLASEGSVPDLFTTSIRIYGTLFVILAVSLIAFYFAKNYFFKGTWALNKEKLINVIVTNPIGAKKAISLVEVAGEILVLGVSNNQISMLTRIEDTETIQKLKQYKNRFQKTNPLGGFKFPISFKKKDKSSSSAPDFSSQLRSFVSNSPEPEFSEPTHNSAADVTRMIQERLGKVKKREKIDLFVEEN